MLDDKELEQVTGGYYYIIETICSEHCGACLDVCKKGAVSIKNNKCYIEASLCDGCGECAEVCPFKCIHSRW